MEPEDLLEFPLAMTKEDYEHVRDHFEGLLICLFSSEDASESNLINALEEMGSALLVDVPERELVWEAL